MSKAPAFTLLECMIVIGVLLIVSIISVPRLDFLNRLLVRNELEKIAMLASHLQRSAMVNGVAQELYFDIKNNQFGEPGSLQPVDHRVLFGAAPGVVGPPSLPTHAVHSPITFAGNTIIFYPDGKMRPGAVYLTDQNKRYCYALTVAVSTVSYLRRYYYNNGLWELIL